MKPTRETQNEQTPRSTMSSEAQRIAIAGKTQDCRYAKVKLGKSGLFAIVDAEDFPKVQALGAWNIWKHRGQIYAMHQQWLGVGTHPKNIKLHRFIMQAKPREIVMHRSGIGLDCSKENLRFGNHKENGASHRRKQGRTSKFRGVSRNIGRGKPWQAFITTDSETIYLGRFSAEEEAASAYNDAAITHFGEHASLNTI